MKDSKTQGNNSNKSARNVLLRSVVGIALVISGFRVGYLTDSDWDKDGVPNEVEAECGMDPRRKDSDADGIQDGDDLYPLVPESEGFFTDTNTVICLTSPTEKRKTVCFYPADILFFEKGAGGYEVFDWRGEVKYVQENLTTIEGMILNVGYAHFFRINPQDLANMELAECITRDMTKLYMSREENLWCPVPREKRQIVVMRVNRFCDDDDDE